MDTDKGIYRKFRVTRTDGSSKKGKKHANCRYFVLDLSCDDDAAEALQAYAARIESRNPTLASDLMHTASDIKYRRGPHALNTQ